MPEYRLTSTLRVTYKEPVIMTVRGFGRRAGITYSTFEEEETTGCNVVLGARTTHGTEVGELRSGGLYEFKLASPDITDLTASFSTLDSLLMSTVLEEMRRFLTTQLTKPVCYKTKTSISCAVEGHFLREGELKKLFVDFLDSLKSELEAVGAWKMVEIK